MLLSRSCRSFPGVLFAALLMGFSPAPPLPAASTRDFLKKPEAWYATEEARKIAGNILSYQSEFGGWPKNLDLTAAPFQGKPAELVGELKPIFDNGATTDEVRYLARMHQATGEAAYARAIENALDYILIAQYPTGGWPQFYPPDREYHRHITYNDDSMVRILTLLHEMGRAPQYGFLDPDRRKAAGIAFERGIDCILKCQITVQGKLTAWCAQHDDVDLSPRPARKFELVSLSGAESANIVRLLMSLPSPSPQVVQAVEGAVAWFRSARIEGWRIKEKTGPEGTGNNFEAVRDTTAAPLWARFYDIETNAPLWSDRDGKRRLGMAQVGWARHGYAWTGNWPQKLLEKDYPAWQAKLAKEGPGADRAPWVPKGRIALAGDSTVTDTAGWGFGFKKAVAAGVLCQNFAGGGQSSKSFRDTGSWQRLLDSKPEVVLIQFGHNDMPGKGPKRETDPATTYAENLARYVEEVRASGAQPVLVTSLVRRIFDRTGTGKLRGELAPYADAARKVAAEKQVPLIDLYTLSLAHAEKLGPEGVAPYEPVQPAPPPATATTTPPSPAPPATAMDAAAASTPAPAPAAVITANSGSETGIEKAWKNDIDFTPSAPDGQRRDGTHLNVKGSIEYGRRVAEELAKVMPAVREWVRKE